MIESSPSDATQLAAWIIGAVAAVHPAVRRADGRQRLGPHHRHRAALRAARARPQHRRRLRRPARPRLRRLLCGRRLHAGPARLAAADRHLPGDRRRLPERAARALVGGDPARRGGGRHRRRAARGTDAEAARRLPGDRHPRLRRDRARVPQQPRRAGQHHQRPERHHRDRRDHDLRASASARPGTGSASSGRRSPTTTSCS